MTEYKILKLLSGEEIICNLPKVLLTGPGLRLANTVIINVVTKRPKIIPPIGATHADVLREAHLIRLELDEYNINQKHLALAIEKLSKSMRPSLSK